MNKDIIEGNWKQIKGKIQQQWGKLTDDDLQKMRGSTQELEGALQKKYGYASEQAVREVKHFIETNRLH